MNGELPDPLVPREVDLRGYEFMHLYGDRLFKSETWISAKPEQKVAMLQLWWHAFAKEVPAASLPDNDQLLTNYAGFGVAVSAWKKARAQVLRGFVQCSDGRLYHPFLAELAICAWKARLADRLRGVKARIGATQKRLRDATSERDKAHISGLLQTQEQELSQIAEWSVTADKYHLSQGQKGKERKGEERVGDSSSKTVAASNNASTGSEAAERAPPGAEPGKPPQTSETPEASAGTLRGAMAKALRDDGVVGVTGSHPTITAWVAEGVTVQLVREAVDLARDRKPKPEQIPLAYLAPIVEQLRNPQPNQKRGNGAAHVVDWWQTEQGVREKGRELGIEGYETEDVRWLKCAIAVKAGGDHWPWVDPKNATQQRWIDDLRRESERAA